MPLRYAAEPENGPMLVRAALTRFARHPTSPINHLAHAVEQMALPAPHAVYDLHADEIAAGKGLESAHLTGVRYVVQSGQDPVAAAELHAGATDGVSFLANLNYGPFVASSARALSTLDVSEHTQTATYEARLLRFSAIYLLAIWLKADAGGKDSLHPLSPAPAPLEAGATYTAEAFLAAIRPLAQTRVSTIAGHSVP